MRNFVFIILLFRFLFTNPIGIAILILFWIGMSSGSDVLTDFTCGLIGCLIIIAIIIGICSFFKMLSK